MGNVSAGTQQEMDIAAVLNTLLYSDYCKEINEPDSFAQIVARMGDNETYKNTEEYKILEAALKNNPKLGGLHIQKPSWQGNGDYNSGTFACVFTDGKGTNYLAYRGTGDGEWIDNGEGMTEIQTTQQKEAVQYFDRTAEKLGWTEADHIIVCGHSKGGNKAQTVTLFSEHSNLIDSCYSLDGQGFSPEAIAYLKETLGEEEYQRRLEKMYALRGENDYVSGLGVTVIPEENTYFIDTNEDAMDFPGHHKVQNMLDENGHLLPEGEQGPYSAFAEQLSEKWMALPPEERAECAMVIMQIMELGDDIKVGLDGDHMTLDDLLGFMDKGLPLILNVLLFTEEGRDLLKEAGSDIISKFYEEYGLGKTILAGLGITALFPLAACFVFSIHEIAAITNRILELYEAGKEFVTTQIRNLAELLEKWTEKISDICEKIGDWLQDHLAGNVSDEYEIQFRALEQSRQELAEQYRQIQGQVAELKTIRRNMDFGLAARIALSLKINRCIRQMEEIGRMLKKMSECLEWVGNRYRRAEGKIAGNYVEIGA